jgi:prepilin-type N-terminal cleavage/methylation domain-containing protein
MNTTANNRQGFTLVELILVIAIIAILIGLLLGGIAKVRATAEQVESQNNLRQIVLAVHHYADAHKGALPVAPLNEKKGRFTFPVKHRPSVFVSILPYCDQANAYVEIRKKKPGAPIPLFISPADPTAPQGLSRGFDICSYAANALVFRANPRMPQTFVDGTSNTLAFAEHYSYQCQQITFSYLFNMPVSAGFHRATFADFGDWRPTEDGLPNVGQNVPVPTFQTAPRIADCISLLAQTPHDNGMVVALGDGSVRILSPGMSPRTYWGAVTPDGGEVLGGDWYD